MPTLTDNFLKNNLALIGLIVVLGFAAHSAMLPAPFKALDDGFSIVENADLRDFANTGKIFTSSFFGKNNYYRPMVMFSFMVEYHLFGLRPFFYNLTNLILHLSMAVTVFFIVLNILKCRPAGFFSALLFAVHPVQWEAVHNIPGRAVLLSSFFTLTAFYLYMKGGEAPRKGPYLAGSLLLFACGLLSKESAAMLPVLLAAYMLILERDRKRYAILFPYFAIIILYVFARHALGITATYPWRTPGEYLLGFITFLRVCLTYARVVIWPVDLHFDRSRAMFLSLNDPEAWAAVLAFLGGLFILFKERKRINRAVWFFMAWTCIELAPVSQLVTTIGVQPGYISAAEHFLYMPVIGVFVLIALGVEKLFALNRAKEFCSATTLRAIVAGFVLFLVLIAARQGLEARTSYTMFRQTLRHNPKNTRILYALGMEMVSRGDFARAEDLFRRALAVDPLYLVARLALGRALYDQGKYTEAVAVLESIRDPGSWGDLLKTNLNLAYQGAIGQYQSMIERAPHNAQLHYSLGTVYSRTEQIEKGIEQYLLAVTIDPNYKNALFNLASSYEALRDFEAAAVYYERLIARDAEIDGMDRFAIKQLNGIYQRSGQSGKARALMNRYQDIGPL